MILVVSYRVPVFFVVSPGRTVPSRISSRRANSVCRVVITPAQIGLEPSRRMFQSSNCGMSLVVDEGSWIRMVPLAREPA